MLMMLLMILKTLKITPQTGDETYENFALVPRNMRLSPPAASAAYANGNVVILSRLLGRLVPVRSDLDWGECEDIDWGSRLSQHASPEENPFLGVQFTKEKTLGVPLPATVAVQLRAWLLQEGLGAIVEPEALSSEYWVNATRYTEEGDRFD